MKYIPYHKPKPLRNDIKDYLESCPNSLLSRPLPTSHSLPYTCNTDSSFNCFHSQEHFALPSDSNSLSPRTPKYSVLYSNPIKNGYPGYSYSSPHYSLPHTEPNLQANRNSSSIESTSQNQNAEIMKFRIQCDVLLAKLTNFKTVPCEHKKLIQFKENKFKRNFIHKTIEEDNSKTFHNINTGTKHNKLDELIEDEEDNLSDLADELVDTFELDTIKKKSNIHVKTNRENKKNILYDEGELKLGDLIKENDGILQSKEFSPMNSGFHKKKKSVDSEKKFTEDLYTLTESNEKEKHFLKNNINLSSSLTSKPLELNEKDISTINKEILNCESNNNNDLLNIKELPTLNKVLQNNKNNRYAIEEDKQGNYNNRTTFQEIGVQTSSDFNNYVPQSINLNINQQVTSPISLKKEESKDNLINSNIFSSSELNRGSFKNETENESDTRFKPTIIETLPDFKKQNLTSEFHVNEGIYVNSKLNETNEITTINNFDIIQNQITNEINNEINNVSKEDKLYSSNFKTNTDDEDLTCSAINDKAQQKEEEEILLDSKNDLRNQTKQQKQTSQSIKQLNNQKSSKSVSFNVDDLRIIEYEQDDLITNLTIYDYYANEIPFQPKNMKPYFTLLNNLTNGTKKLQPCIINLPDEYNEINDRASLHVKHNLNYDENEDEENEDIDDEENNNSSFTINGKKYTVINPIPSQTKCTQKHKSIFNTTTSTSNNSSSTRSHLANINELQDENKSGNIWIKAKEIKKDEQEQQRLSCKRFVEKPQKIFTEDLSDNVLQSFELKTKSSMVTPKQQQLLNNINRDKHIYSEKKERQITFDILDEQQDNENTYSDHLCENKIRKFSL